MPSRSLKTHATRAHTILCSSLACIANTHAHTGIYRSLRSSLWTAWALDVLRRFASGQMQCRAFFFTQTHCGICGLKGMPRRSDLTQESKHACPPPVFSSSHRCAIVKAICGYGFVGCPPPCLLFYIPLVIRARHGLRHVRLCRVSVAVHGKSRSNDEKKPEPNYS